MQQVTAAVSKLYKVNQSFAGKKTKSLSRINRSKLTGIYLSNAYRAEVTTDQTLAACYQKYRLFVNRLKELSEDNSYFVI